MERGRSCKPKAMLLHDEISLIPKSAAAPLLAPLPYCAVFQHLGIHQTNREVLGQALDSIAWTPLFGRKVSLPATGQLKTGEPVAQTAQDL